MAIATAAIQLLHLVSVSFLLVVTASSLIFLTDMMIMIGCSDLILILIRQAGSIIAYCYNFLGYNTGTSSMDS